MDKILITYGTRPFAQRIGALLSPVYEVGYASAESFPDLLLRGNYHRIPTGANPTFVHELLKLCLDKGYQLLLPLGKLELQPLHEARILLAEYGIEVLLPSELADCPLMESPSGELCILQEGKDLLTGEKRCDSTFSGVVMLSDSGEEALLCIV